MTARSVGAEDLQGRVLRSAIIGTPPSAAERLASLQILVWKFSRFTRKREHAVAFESMLRRRGIRVTSMGWR